MDGHSATSTKVRISGSTKIDDFCGTRHAASHHKNNKIETTKPLVSSESRKRCARKAMQMHPKSIRQATNDPGGEKKV